MEAPNSSVSISLSQVLEEALTTSKVMTGRRLLDCGLSPGRRLGFFDDIVDWVDDTVDVVIDPIAEAAKKAAELVARNLLVCDLLRGFKVTWDAASKVAVDAANKAKDLAVNAANKAKDLAVNAANAAKDLAVDAANAAKELAIDAKERAEKAFEDAKEGATKFIDDVGNAFSELGEEIQCAAPLPPKGRAPAVVARQWPRTPPAPLCGILAQRADVWTRCHLAGVSLMEWRSSSATLGRLPRSCWTQCSMSRLTQLVPFQT